jgi:CO/xanthine dehydrogenase Mo-binding subunit
LSATPYVPPVLTTADLARLLRVSETAVRRMNLPAVEVGRGRWRYVTAQVLEELARRAERGGLAISRGA